MANENDKTRFFYSKLSIKCNGCGEKAPVKLYDNFPHGWYIRESDLIAHGWSFEDKHEVKPKWNPIEIMPSNMYYCPLCKVIN